MCISPICPVAPSVIPKVSFLPLKHPKISLKYHGKPHKQGLSANIPSLKSCTESATFLKNPLLGLVSIPPCNTFGKSFDRPVTYKK